MYSDCPNWLTGVYWSDCRLPAHIQLTIAALMGWLFTVRLKRATFELLSNKLKAETAKEQQTDTQNS